MNKRHEQTFLKNKTLVTNNMKRCPTSLIIRNMQLRPQLVTTLLFLFEIKKIHLVQSVDKSVEPKELR